MKSRPTNRPGAETAVDDLHDAVVASFTSELVAHLNRAAGNERKVLDTAFLFALELERTQIASRWRPEIFGAAIARSRLSPGDRERVFRMFPRCDAFARLKRDRRLSLDVGEAYI